MGRKDYRWWTTFELFLKEETGLWWGSHWWQNKVVLGAERGEEEGELKNTVSRYNQRNSLWRDGGATDRKRELYADETNYSHRPHPQWDKKVLGSKETHRTYLEQKLGIFVCNFDNFILFFFLQTSRMSLLLYKTHIYKNIKIICNNINFLFKIISKYILKFFLLNKI